MPYHMKLVSASGDHTAKLWAVTEAELVNLNEFHGHSRSVKTAVFRKNDCSVFATGGRDGAIFVWDIRASLNTEIIPKVDNRIFNAHSCMTPGTPQSRRRSSRNTTPKLPPNVCNSSITGLAFQDEYTLISCGPGDGIIKVWDLRRCYTTLKKEPVAKHSLMYAGKSTFKGFTNLVVNESGSRLFANCMDSKIYCYNISSYEQRPQMVYDGLFINTFYIKSCLSPDGKYLLSGSSNNNAYIWNLNNPQPLAELTGHAYEVTCVAWSQHQNNLDGGNMTIVTCSDDSNHKIWRIGPETIPEDELAFLKGKAEANKEYFEPRRKPETKFLESTPRSLKRLVEMSEKTPTSCIKKEPVCNSSKSAKKRSFSEMNVDPEVEVATKEGSDLKRPNLEARGRRLFSPSEPSTSSCFENDIYSLEGTSRSLATILEEIGSPTNQNFQNVSPVSRNSSTKRQLNIIQSPAKPKSLVFSCASPSVAHDVNPILNSPTSNLPNYVMTGEAPHLSLMSPQRKVKREPPLDWLTKIRKQKLLSLNNNLNLDKVPTNVQDDCDEITNLENINISNSSGTITAKIKSENKEEINKLTPSSKKQEATLLRFFSVRSTTKAVENCSPNRTAES